MRNVDVDLPQGLHRVLASIGAPLLASRWLRNRLLAPEIAQSEMVTAGVAAFKDRFECGVADQKPPSAEEHPVFVFSAGWGAGSTLLQRLLISSGEAIVWGEPVDEAVTIHRMARSVATVRADWPPREHFRAERASADLVGEWIANFAPDMSHYREAHRQFLLTWLGSSAHGIEGARWGLKEVRLTIDHARYLKWLFPGARFVFIYRDIYDSYLSIRRRPWTSVWPQYPATPIVPFAQHWSHLLRGFIDGHEDVGGLMIKYEDLISGQVDLDTLARHAGVQTLDGSLLERKVGGRSRGRRPLILPERLVLDSIGGDLRDELGYR